AAISATRFRISPSRKPQSAARSGSWEMLMPMFSVVPPRSPQGDDTPATETASAAERLARTELTQPALVAVEHALARLWMSWGIRPWAMIGHSIGEYVAACLAGVFTLEEALPLVAERGRLIAGLPAGAMLAVALPEDELRAELSDELALAAVNGPRRCVVSGPAVAVAALAERLAERGVGSRPLHTSHAFHSAMMDPILDAFTQRLRQVRLAAPRLRYLSNLTGEWIRDDEATDPAYWARHLRATVRFGDGVATALAEADCIPVEVGPGTSLATFVRERPSQTATLPSLPHPNDRRS
ncbi:MAG: acyltransferase domain-containing protein, partial [bacterium]|nr:acyltransferase domain-containing protein [bacterium]